jgi:aminoglycoside/choline kinase family phosphotransferase
LSNQHYQQFFDWIVASVPEAIKLVEPMQFAPLAGDAGFRRYYRTNTVPSLIAVDSPPAKENNSAYLNIAHALQSQMVRTPIIHGVNTEQGFMLLEDFGEQLLLPALNQQSVDSLYDQAETCLLQIQQLQPNEQIFPNYDSQRLRDEMALFPQWFVGELLDSSLHKDETAMLEKLFTSLVENALEQPQVLVHRDYHSRNLMLLADGDMGVIDFQDAVWGPVTYDLVSLLKDCYVRWPAAMVQNRALAFKQRLLAADPGLDIEDQQFLRWFDLMGLQRHIKVMGIFARLALRDGKRGYLQDLPMVIDYSLEAASQYPETEEFCHWFERRVRPLLQSQRWYSAAQKADL